MTFFLDENFPKKAYSLLDVHGFKVIDIRGTKDEGLTDKDIFKLCQKHQAVFLTTDRDFFHTIHFTSKPHFGIIVINLKNPNAKNILEKLAWFLQTEHVNALADTCYLIQDTKYMVYK